MNPEEKKLLERAVALGEENNKILRGIRRGNRWAIAYNIIYWIAIIALSFGAYVYLQPYLEQLMKMYADISGTVNNVSKIGDQIPDIQNMLNSLPK